MSGAVLRCTKPKIELLLPWWPSDVTATYAGWNVDELARPGREPLEVASTQTLDEYTVGFTLRREDHRTPIAEYLNDLRALAASRKPSTLTLGEQSLGLFRLEPPQATILQWATNGKPSVADVQLTLKRASDATVRVGLVKRVKGRAKNMRRA